MEYKIPLTLSLSHKGRGDVNPTYPHLKGEGRRGYPPGKGG